MLDALQALGQPVETVPRPRRARRPRPTKAVAKGLPKDLDWFAWDGLPAVRWADSASRCRCTILQWLLAQAVKAKSPEPNAMLRKYCRHVRGRATASGSASSSSRPGSPRTSRPIDPSEAQRQARSRPRRAAPVDAAASPQYYQDDPLRQERRTSRSRRRYLPVAPRAARPARPPRARACWRSWRPARRARRRAAGAQRYLKEWYGMRASQGKALIVMLAWIDHPSATQLMLSVGSRFRTKSFQEEATRQAEALAERKGWTVGELADRTIPTAGLRRRRACSSCRTATACSPRACCPTSPSSCATPEGKAIKALPAPRQTDDEDQVKEAKKALAAAKKELKARRRRSRPSGSTRRCAPSGPGRSRTGTATSAGTRSCGTSCQRLVWVGDARRRRDAAGLPAARRRHAHRRRRRGGRRSRRDARVRLAHDSNLDADQVAAWQAAPRRLRGARRCSSSSARAAYALPDEQRPARRSTDFEGHLLEAFALRGRARKLGYTRGPGRGRRLVPHLRQALPDPRPRPRRSTFTRQRPARGEPHGRR